MFLQSKKYLCSTEIKAENATLNELYVIENSFRTSHSQKCLRESFSSFVTCESLRTRNFQFSWFPKLKNSANGLIRESFCTCSIIILKGTKLDGDLRRLKYQLMAATINSTNVGGGGGLTPLWFFQKCIFQKEGETVFFVTFNIIISQYCLSILATFMDFHQFFGFLNISLR